MCLKLKSIQCNLENLTGVDSISTQAYMRALFQLKNNNTQMLLLQQPILSKHFWCWQGTLDLFGFVSNIIWNGKNVSSTLLWCMLTYTLHVCWYYGNGLAFIITFLHPWGVHTLHPSATPTNVIEQVFSWCRYSVGACQHCFCMLFLVQQVGLNYS